jgi:hypothetical protein
MSDMNLIVEAVIISGPRKGEIIPLPTDTAELTPAEEAALDEIVESAHRLVENTYAAVAAAEALRDELRLARQEVRNEPA